MINYQLNNQKISAKPMESDEKIKWSQADLNR